MKTGLTKYQKKIIKLLEKLDTQISAQSLYIKLRSSNPHVGLATVYRSLETLKKSGLVQSRTKLNGESLYSLVDRDRHYVTCVDCGDSIPLDFCPIKELEGRLYQSLPFKIFYHTLEFYGLCPLCSQEREKDKHPQHP